MTALEAYLPVAQFVMYVGGWATAMLTGLVFLKVVE